jgi:SAM-dependent methyltransferase
MRLYEVLATEYKDIFPSSQEKVDFLEKYLKEGKSHQILDIGCASGEFAHQLSSASREIIGIDLDLLMIEEARTLYLSVADSMIHFEQADMLLFLSDSDPDKYDLISCLGNTIVYLDGESELIDFLRSAKEALKEHGTLVIQILNYGNPQIMPGFIFPGAETEKIEFQRQYESLEDSLKFGFKTTIKDKSTGETDTDLHYHHPFLSDRIAEIAQKVGFKDSNIYGGYDGKDSEVSDFFHLIVLKK